MKIRPLPTEDLKFWLKGEALIERRAINRGCHLLRNYSPALIPS